MTEKHAALVRGTSYYPPENPVTLKVLELPFNQLTIPSYQRPYKWRETHIKRFLHDLENFKSCREYSLGTLVLWRDKNGDKPELDIVDGQQRIVTIALILYQLLIKEGRSVEKNIYPNIDGFIGSLKEFLMRDQFSIEIAKRNICANLRIIERHSREVTDEILAFLLCHCEFTVITLHDLSEAFQFFDSQSSRGLDLAPHNLLKPFHLRCIEALDDEDKKNIEAWNNSKRESMQEFFLLLYRVRRWMYQEEAKTFTKHDVDAFKGCQIREQPYHFQRCALENWKNVRDKMKCNTTGRVTDNPVHYRQLKEEMLNGSPFFDFIIFYRKILKDLIGNEQKDGILRKKAPEVIQAVEGLKSRQGDKYVRRLFYAACLLYYDRFGEAVLDRALEKIFAWVYRNRLDKYAIRLATIDKLARGEDSSSGGGGRSFFAMLRDAKEPLEILDWDVPLIDAAKLKIEPKDSGVPGLTEVKQLMEKLGYGS